MGWLREKHTKKSIIVFIGPYVAARHVIFTKNVLLLLSAAVFMTAFIFLFEVFSNSSNAHRFFGSFVKREWVFWMIEHPLQTSLGAIALTFIFHRLSFVSDRIANLFFNKKQKVVFTAEKVKLHKFWFFYISRSRKENITFEVILHPRATQKPLNAKEKPHEEIFERTGVVIMRSGVGRPITIANIFDRRAFKLGHKAEQLAQYLQNALNKPITSAKISKGSNTDFYEERALR